MRIPVDGINLEMAESWRASKLDDWSYYKRQFQRIGGFSARCKVCGDELECPTCRKKGFTGVKSVDLLAVDPGVCCWLIEVKDYRRSARTKAIELPDEIALKVRDSLALLAGARVNSSDVAERSLADAALRCPTLRVVLHLEQGAGPSRLAPRPIDTADVKQKLRQRIKAVDPHALVVDTGTSGTTVFVPWTASV